MPDHTDSTLRSAYKTHLPESDGVYAKTDPSWVATARQFGVADRTEDTSRQVCNVKRVVSLVLAPRLGGGSHSSVAAI